MAEETQAGRRYNIGITDYVQPPPDVEREAFPEADFVYLRDWREDEAAREQWRRAEGLLAWHRPLDRELLPYLENCRIVVRYGVGYDTVEVPAMAERDIPVCNTPDYGTEEVADAACAMILALQRKTVQYDRECRRYADTWQENLLKPLRRTRARTLGVIGVGRIGTAVINRMKPFGYRILGYDPYKPSGHEKAVGYERAWDLGELLPQADVITLHCPLTEETRGMVDEAFFERLKPGASLVNTARGAILASLSCLEKALRSRRLASAAVDVLASEPPADHSLLRAWREDAPWLRGRLIINPHVAWYSKDAWHEMRYKAAETARMWLVEGRLRNRVAQSCSGPADWTGQ